MDLIAFLDLTLRLVQTSILNHLEIILNTERLTRNWRPIWTGIFNEFKDTQFIIHDRYGTSTLKMPPNVECRKGVK